MKAFGFDTQEVNGNDVEAIYTAVEKAKTVKGMPHAIILNTVKGNGVPDIVGMFKNHGVNVETEKWSKWQNDVKSELEKFDLLNGEA